VPSKARPDKEGFVTATGSGIVPLRIGPTSLDRALRILSQFFTLAEPLGYKPKVIDAALILVVDGEAVAFGIEEYPEKTLHIPTPEELRRQADHTRWGSRMPWPRYDLSPPQRLALVINENSYSGHRRTYADGKTQTLEELLPAILGGFAEHAALLKENRRAAEVRQRQWKEADARRMHRKRSTCANGTGLNSSRGSASSSTNVRSSRPCSLIWRIHLESRRAGWSTMVVWLKRRIKQIDALLSPLFLDISARCDHLDLAEVRGDPKWEEESRYRSGRANLQFWEIDEQKGQACSRTALQWAIEAGLVPGFEASQRAIAADSTTASVATPDCYFTRLRD